MRSCFKIGHDLRQIEGLRRSTVGARAESQMTRRSLVRESSSSTRSIGRHRVAGSLPPRNPSRTASRQLPTFFLSRKRERKTLSSEKKRERVFVLGWLAAVYFGGETTIAPKPSRRRDATRCRRQRTAPRGLRPAAASSSLPLSISLDGISSERDRGAFEFLHAEMPTPVSAATALIAADLWGM